MLYSRFDDRRGLYDVFEDSLERAVNADLPIPNLGPVVGQIGVPASTTGRELPAGARRVGESWHAKGLIVAPSAGAALGLLDDYSTGSKVWLGALVVGSAVVSYLIARKHRRG
jgi:hypothetical protein